MRLQLPKNADPENPHKYWVFEACRSYTVAAEQKARVTYDNILRLSDDPDVNNVIKFLREREIVHFQRFGDAKLTHSNRFIYKVHNQKKGLSKHGSPFGFYSSPLYSSLFINFIHLFCHLAIIATV